MRLALRLGAAGGTALLALAGFMIAFAPSTSAADTGPQSLVLCAPGAACVPIPLVPALSGAPDLAATINQQFVFQCGQPNTGSAILIPFITQIVFCESGVHGNDAFPLQIQENGSSVFTIGSTDYSASGGNSTAGLFTAGGSIFLCTQEAGQPC